MGICFYYKSGVLFYDLPLEDNYPAPKNLYAAVDQAFEQNALNCWIAACIYMFVLVLSGNQLYENSRIRSSS